MEAASSTHPMTEPRAILPRRGSRPNRLFCTYLCIHPKFHARPRDNGSLPVRLSMSGLVSVLGSSASSRGFERDIVGRQAGRTRSTITSNNKWSDAWHRHAKHAGFVSRSAFKLLQIQQKHKIIPVGGRILDLGCAPGGWLQAACKLIGDRSSHPNARVVGVDVRRFDLPRTHCDDRISVLHSDVERLRNLDLSEALERTFGRSVRSQRKGKIYTFDAVISDMAPSTTGVRDMDAENAARLARVASRIALGVDEDEVGILRKGGHLVIKIYDGVSSESVRRPLIPHFERTVWMRPSATREGSREKYLVALRRKKGPRINHRTAIFEENEKPTEMCVLDRGASGTFESSLCL